MWMRWVVAQLASAALGEVIYRLRKEIFKIMRNR